MPGPAPAVAQVRSAVRPSLTASDQPVLVACSGGADSLALAAAVAFEAPRAGVPAGAVTVDHGLQPGSDARAAATAGLLRNLGLGPVSVVVTTTTCFARETFWTVSTAETTSPVVTMLGSMEIETASAGFWFPVPDVAPADAAPTAAMATTASSVRNERM